jgi:hypothetical protein
MHFAVSIYIYFIWNIILPTCFKYETEIIEKMIFNTSLSLFLSKFELSVYNQKIIIHIEKYYLSIDVTHFQSKILLHMIYAV